MFTTVFRFKDKALTSRCVISVLSLLLASLSAAHSHANTAFPLINQQNINADQHYVFYSHGYIVEGEDPTPIETKHGWGKYDFPAIKTALSDPAYQLVAHHRPKNTDPFVYARFLSEQIKVLINQGVSPSHITLVGFSRGAFITGLTSNLLADFAVNTVILAGCGRLIAKKHDDIQVYGHVLSIYESSDQSGSCERLKTKSNEALSFSELAIHTGLSHGAFYTPNPVWVEPVKSWIRSKHTL